MFFNFTNILGETLVLAKHEEWRFCLQSISLTNINDEPEIQKAKNLISSKEDLFNKALEKIENYRTKNKALHVQATETIYKQASGIIDTKSCRLLLFHPNTLKPTNNHSFKIHAKFPVLHTLENQSMNWEMAVTRVSFVPQFKKNSFWWIYTLVTDVDDFASQLSTHTWNDYLSDKSQQSIHIKYYDYSKPSSLVVPLSEAFAAI